MAYANIRGNMLCWTKIYAIFWDRGRACFLEKKSKAQKHIQIFSMLRSGFSFRKTRSVTVPRFGFFFHDSRINEIFFKYDQSIILLFYLKVFEEFSSWLLEFASGLVLPPESPSEFPPELASESSLLFFRNCFRFSK